MASRFEVEVTVTSAKDLKNVNWRNGPLVPYAVLWVDSDHRKVTSRVDEEGDTSPQWDHTLVVPFDRPIDDDAILFIDIVHANADEDTKPLIGSAKLPLMEVVDEVGMGGRAIRKLKLKRPSGRPQGKVSVEVLVRDCRYRYAPPPPAGYAYGQPQAGYDQPSYRQDTGYDQPSYGQGGSYYGQDVGGGGGGRYEKVVVQEEEKKSKFGGMGTGLAIGAAAGVVGGLGLAYGIHELADHFEDEAAEEAEEEQEQEQEEDDD